MRVTLSRPLRTLALCCLAAAGLVVPRSVADDRVDAGTLEILTSIDNDQLLEIMDDEGYAASVNDDDVIIWKVEGFRAQLFVSKRNEGRNLQFHTAFNDSNATPKKVNEWNRTKRYSKTYLDEEGDPHLELDLDLEGGVTRARIVDYLQTCRQSFVMWQREVLE